MSYRCVLKDLEESEKNKFVVTITADLNDADFLTSTASYSKENFYYRGAGVLADLLINYNERYDLLKLDDGDYAGMGLPFNTVDGNKCHSLESIKVIFIDEQGKIRNVNFNLS